MSILVCDFNILNNLAKTVCNFLDPVNQIDLVWKLFPAENRLTLTEQIAVQTIGHFSEALVLTLHSPNQILFGHKY